jgi:hypothetical protein
MIMAPNKPKTRTWYDVQMAIAAVAMSLTLALWNLFAGPDRAQAARKMVEETQATPAVPTEAPVVALTPAPMPIVKIIFGSSAPQQTTITTSSSQNSPRNNRNNGGGGGSTKTS